jgi:GT2 family glycosyltransferase
MPFSGIVSNARDYVNSLPLVYTPGIALRKNILSRIGGFMFNNVVPYAVDADLNYRVWSSKTPVIFSGKSIINHSAESLNRDLKAAYRIGGGCAASYKSLKKMPQFSSIRWNDLKGVPMNRLPDLLTQKGFLVFVYQIIWDTAFWYGYIRRRISN